MEKSGSHTGKNQVARETSGNSTFWWSRKVTTRNKRQASGRTKATCSTSLRCSPEAEASHCVVLQIQEAPWQDSRGTEDETCSYQFCQQSNPQNSRQQRKTCWHKKAGWKQGLPGEGDGVHSTLVCKIPWRGAWPGGLQSMAMKS